MGLPVHVQRLRDRHHGRVRRNPRRFWRGSGPAGARRWTRRWRTPRRRSLRAYMIDYEGFEPNEISGRKPRGALLSPGCIRRRMGGWRCQPRGTRNCNDYLRQSVRGDSRVQPGGSAGAGVRVALDLRMDGDTCRGRCPSDSLRTLEDARSDPYARGQGADRLGAARGVWLCRTRRGGAALSKTPARTGASPVFGGDTESVLIELGYTQEEIYSMRSDGVIPNSGGLPLS